MPREGRANRREGQGEKSSHEYCQKGKKLKNKRISEKVPRKQHER